MSNSPTVLKRWIAYELRQLRERSGVERQAAAARIGRNISHIGHIETGRNLPAPTEVEVLLDLYGVPERSEFFRELVRRAKKGTDWWLGFSDAVRDWFSLYLGLESSAVQLESYNSIVVPGLFQTSAYAEAIIRGWEPELSDAEVAKRVELRLARQHVLDRDPDPLRVWAVLDESVLRRAAGGPAVLRDQLEHLVKLAKRPNIDLQVLPANAGAHTGTDGTFVLMTFPPELPGSAVYVQTLITGIYYEDAAEVLRYRNALTRLRVQAVTPEESSAVIVRIAEELTA